MQARQTLEETRWLLQLASETSFVLGVVGWVDLRSADVRSELTALAKQKKFVGVRHIVQSEPDDRFLLQPEFLRGVAMLEEFGLTYDILIYERHLPVASEFVREVSPAEICAGPLGQACRQSPCTTSLGRRNPRAR